MRVHTGPYQRVLAAFAEGWAPLGKELALSFDGEWVEFADEHALAGELQQLCAGQAASLPFCKETEVKWCTLAPTAAQLLGEIATLQAWVLPSFAAEDKPALIPPGAGRGELVARIMEVSTGGYYRWRSPWRSFRTISERMALRRRLEAARPRRQRPYDPSRYELRVQFVAALLMGDRPAAELAVRQLDELQLETALNTLFMRVRVWHQFREFERIRTDVTVQALRGEALPPRVQAWIDEAFGEISMEEPPSAEAKSIPLPAEFSPEQQVKVSAQSESVAEEIVESLVWSSWFVYVRRGKEEDRRAAELFLEEERTFTAENLSGAEQRALIEELEHLALDPVLCTREYPLLGRGLAELIGDYVREPDFPRSELGRFYLALAQAWSALHAGCSSGKEHGHVLLELADAAMRMRQPINEVQALIQEWWETRRSVSLLPFLLDAIELLDRELPLGEGPYELWTAAMEFLQRDRDYLTPSERELWLRAGRRLGFTNADLARYLPSADGQEASEADPLAQQYLKHVAVVCMRERQANEAAVEIKTRSGAKLTLVTGGTAGAETTEALKADVVLMVWMATKHAVFRAFDGFDRDRIAYVQGTGAASILRALERWITTQVRPA